MSGKGHFEPSMSILLSLLLVCSLILVFITACAADTQAESRRQLPDCEQFGANCSTCTAKGGCGWCMRPTSGGLLNGSCVAGDNSGATGPATCSLWFYQNCHNVGACEASTCGACTVLTPAGTGCGWCAATNVCLPGNSSGPSEAEHATCPKPFWVWGRANCALEPSISASASPTSSPSPSPSSSPLPSSSSSPSPSTSPSLSPSTSPSPSVSASASPSPGHDDRCPMLASNCTTCVAGAQCLWCPATATCFNVTRVPPSQCPNGATNECNDEFCGNITSCADCTKQAVCGWCNYTRCVAGRTSGPAHGSCSAYQYNSCAPLSCSSFGDCATCTQPGNTHCAWCDPTSRCMPILNPPPRPGDAECPHNWFYLECPAPVECSRYRNCVECMDFAPHCWWCTNDPFQLCASSPQSGYSCMQQPDQCAAPPRPSGGGGGGLDGGAIAGIVVGSVCAAGIVPAAVFLWYKYYYSPRHHYATLA